MNRWLINQRRRELAVSRRQLGRSAGINPRLIELLEDSNADTIHDTIPLATIRALGSALGLDSAALLQHDQPESLESTAANADAAVVSNVLRRVDRPVKKAQLAMALGWGLARLDRAVASLAPILSAAGLAVCEDPAHIAVAPGFNRSAQRAAAAVMAIDAEHDPDALALIHRAWKQGTRRGPRTTLCDLPEAAQRIARSLLASHILEVNDEDELNLCADIHKCLEPAHLLDERRTIGRY